MSTYRVEHRSGRDGSVLVARTSDVYARQEELSQHAARVMREGATGELVLVDEATGVVVARRRLLLPGGTGNAGFMEVRDHVGRSRRRLPALMRPG